MTYLGIDIGTSGVKALLIDEPAGRWAKPPLRQSRCARIPAGPSRTPPTGGPPRWPPSTSSSKSNASELAAVQRHRPFRPHARRHAAGQERRGAAPRDPLERWPRRVECAEMEARLPGPARHRRQHRHARLHRAQDRLGAQARAGDLREDRQGPAAQSLCPPAADRRACRGHVRRFGHAVARCRQARLVRRPACRHRPQPRAHAAPRRRLRPLRQSQARARPRAGA